MRRLLAAALLLLGASGAGAQEFDIFELNDFVDPRLRGAEYASGGIRTTAPGDPFLVSRLSLGAVRDYYWRTSPTDANLAVAHSATSYYWGGNQLNFKWTHLRTGDDDAFVPKNRGTVQFARYTAHEMPLDVEGKPMIAVSRYLVALAVEESPDALEDLAGHRSMNYELGAQLDVRLPLTDVLGTVSYVKRFAGVGQSTERFAYVLHTAGRSYRKANFEMNVAVGAQKTASWRWGDIRPTAHMRLPLDKVGTIVHLAYAPTISFEGGFETRHEVALFVDRAIFARVFAAKE